jgi:hypothetical protein
MAINPHRKGGPDVPIVDGGTGASTGGAALTNLGGLDEAAHDALDHTGLMGVGGGSGYSMTFGASFSPGQFALVNGIAYTTGEASSHRTRGVAPFASSIKYIGYSASGAGFCNFHKNGGLVQGFAVNGQGSFPAALTAFAAGDYLEIDCNATISITFTVWFSIP